MDNYASLVNIGKPDFIEIKGVTFCGSSKGKFFISFLLFVSPLFPTLFHFFLFFPLIFLEELHHKCLGLLNEINLNDRLLVQCDDIRDDYFLKSP